MFYTPNKFKTISLNKKILKTYFLFKIKELIDTGNFGEVTLRGVLAVSRYARKTPFEKIYWGDAVFDRKIEDFSIKNSVAPQSPPPHAFFA